MCTSLQTLLYVRCISGNIVLKLLCLESHANKRHPNYSDIHQLASADELLEAYQSTTDPDLFQVYSSSHWRIK